MNMTQLQKVGHVTIWSENCLEFYWNPQKRTIIVRGPQGIYEDDDGNIIASIAHFMNCEAHQLCADQIMVFDRKEHGKAADDALKLDIYECEWSDFACENQVIHLNVRNFNWMRDRFEQEAAAIEYDRCLNEAQVDYDNIYRVAEEKRWNLNEDYTPQSPTCGYCSGDGELYIAEDENIRCRDCYSLAVETQFMNHACEC